MGTKKRRTSSSKKVEPEAVASGAVEEVEVDEEREKSFADLGVCPVLCEACEALKWKMPTEIQRESLPYALEGRDIIGLAQTGSGKTAAFVLPILQRLLDTPRGLFACIIAPTRELAFQIGEQVEGLGASIGVKCSVIVGGVDPMAQALQLAQRPHIIVGTPGRIVHHLENTTGFTLKFLHYLVLDEADRLLNLDFEEEIDQILKAAPKQRTTFLFSATMTSKVSKLQRASLRDPVKVEVCGKYATVKSLRQEYCFIPAAAKDCYLAFLLNEFAGNSIIVFTLTCNTTTRLALLLRNLGFPAIPLHGKMSQPKRLGSLNKFKSGDRKILIATDVASRGLDIPSVDLVLNYDITPHPKDYVHRVGRTARAGRAGRSISLITQYDVALIYKIEELIGKKLDLYHTEKETVMIMMERVSEAQRLAQREMREVELGKRSRSSSAALANEALDDGEAGAGGVRRRKNKRKRKH